MDERLERVLSSDDLPAQGGVRRVTVGGTDVLLARLADGRAVAFAATCPHQRTDLGDATVGDGRIRCPLHLYEYDLVTGENVVPTRDLDPVDLRKAAPGRLPVYRVEERDGWLWVEPPAGEPAPAPAPPDLPVADGVLGVMQGITFELRLPTTPRPGFVWRVDTGGPLLAVVGERAEGGDHVVRLTARRAGRATVRCLYARPWDREPAEVRSWEVVVYS